MQEIQGKQKLEAGKLQIQAQTAQSKTQVDMARLQADQQKTQADLAKVQADLKMSSDENERELLRINNSHALQVHDRIVKVKDIAHKHKINEHESVRKSVQMHHDIANQKAENQEGEMEDGA